MTTSTKLDPTTEMLQRLEEQLEVPYVSGELHAWAESVRDLIVEAAVRIRSTIATEHPRLFDTIVKNHSNLRQQVEKLREEDGQLPTALDNVVQQAERFATNIDETALAGQQFQAQRERLVTDGLDLILRLRRHRSAIDTWLGEALQRDNGVGD